MEESEWTAIPIQYVKPILGCKVFMNKIIRNGLDVRIAFQTGLKRNAELPYSQVNLIGTEISQAIERQADPSAKGSNQMSNRVRLKSIVRTFAQYGYRLLKPVLRPVAFRVRHYLMSGLRQELQHEILRASAAISEGTHREIHSIFSTIASELQQDFRKTSAMTTDDFRREIRKLSLATHNELQQEIQRISTVMAMGLQQQNEILCPRLDRIEVYSAATARRVAVNCGPGEVMVKTSVGYVLCAASDHALLSCLLDTGDLEMGTRLLIQKFLKPGDVYVDVGANIGMHTLAAAQAMQGVGKIVAFEPFEPTKRMLEKSIWMNGFSGITEIHQAAVSNITGHQQLFIGATSGHHSLFALDSLSVTVQEPVTVPLVRLDGIISSDQRIDLMKIDVEGAELEVIEGGRALLIDNPDIALIVEFGPSHLQRIGRTPKQWFDSFSQLGLDFKVINHESGALEFWPREALEKVESVNLIFARAGSAAWDRLA